MKVLIVAALMVVIAFQVNADQMTCEIHIDEASCINDCAVDPLNNATKWGCQWISADITNSTTSPGTPSTAVPSECSPSTTDEPAVAPDYVCNKLKKEANDEYAQNFTYKLTNNWNKTDPKCPQITKVLDPNFVYTCNVSKLEFPDCSSKMTQSDCITDTCNDPKHGCQWTQCTYNSPMLNGNKNATYPFYCTNNTISKGDLMNTCCGLVSASNTSKLVSADANFTISISQLDNQLDNCPANVDVSTAKTCGIKKYVIQAKKSTGMAWYWWVLIVLLCLCVCGACGYGGHKELQKRNANQDTEDQEAYYAQPTDTNP